MNWAKVTPPHGGLIGLSDTWQILMEMKTFRPDDADKAELIQAAALLKSANAAAAAAEKSVNAAKAKLAGWLKTKRDCDLEALPIGEVVCIEDVALIKIGSMNKFNEKEFRLAESEMHKKFTRDIPVKRFDPLV